MGVGQALVGVHSRSKKLPKIDFASTSMQTDCFLKHFQQAKDVGKTLFQKQRFQLKKKQIKRSRINNLRSKVQIFT